MFPPPGSSRPALPLAADAKKRVPSRPMPQVVRHQHRERDFGIGYGASSGYAQDKRYTSDWGQARFRCR